MGAMYVGFHCPNCRRPATMRRPGERFCTNCMSEARVAVEDRVKPFPYSAHRGDRNLAAQLLYENGRDPGRAESMNPQTIECLAGMGRLADADLWEAERQWRAEAIGEAS